MAHQEGGRDRGRLDRDPHHAQVVGDHRERHRPEEQADQRAVPDVPGG